MTAQNLALSGLLSFVLAVAATPAWAQGDGRTGQTAADAATEGSPPASSDAATGARTAPTAETAAVSERRAQQENTEEEAGDISAIDKHWSGPLSERIRPVSGHLLRKAGRLELSPSLGVSVRDAFFQKYVFGGAVSYHVSDEVAVTLRGGWSLPVVGATAQICELDPEAGGARGCAPPSFEQLDGRAPGQIRALGGIAVQWAPIYGKLSLLAESFLSFDLYATAGATGVLYSGPSESGGSAELFTPGADLGVGARVFLTPWLTLRLELRDLLYVERIQPLPDTTSFRNQLLFDVGVSVFVP